MFLGSFYRSCEKRLAFGWRLAHWQCNLSESRTLMYVPGCQGVDTRSAWQKSQGLGSLVRRV